MAWIYLTVAGLLEVGWAIGLKYTDVYTPSAIAVDYHQHDSEHRPARIGAQDVAGWDRLCGVDRDRSRRYRRARDLSIRRAGDGVAADMHWPDPLRYRRSQ